MSSIEDVARSTSALFISLSLRRRAGGFLIGNAFVWLSVLVYRYMSYYHGFLSGWTQTMLVYLAVLYSLYAVFFYTLAPLDRIQQANSRLSLLALKKIISGIGNFVKFGPRDYTRPLFNLQTAEKRALLFGIVKFFFIPMMLNFLYANYNDFTKNFGTLGNFGSLLSIHGFNTLLFPMLFSLFLLIDTAFFSFGYLFESGFLANRVRSVEPTAIGWAVALVCYPPFNGLLTGYVSWFASDAPSSPIQLETSLIRLAVLLLMAFYAGASVALGPKASNLTNRGIVGYGPYRIVRHPAYVSKNLAWWLSLIPVLSLQAVISMCIWSSIYFMRAITEERHLSADPDYLEYCKRVRYRFIPGLV